MAETDELGHFFQLSSEILSCQSEGEKTPKINIVSHECCSPKKKWDQMCVLVLKSRDAAIYVLKSSKLKILPHVFCSPQN